MINAGFGSLNHDFLMVLLTVTVPSFIMAKP